LVPKGITKRGFPRVVPEGRSWGFPRGPPEVPRGALGVGYHG
jgi:hypothetical protein